MLEDAAQASRRAAAIDAIKKNNWSIRKAAKQFGIPNTTLQEAGVQLFQKFLSPLSEPRGPPFLTLLINHESKWPAARLFSKLYE